MATFHNILAIKKMLYKQLAHHWQKTKAWMGDRYNEGKKWAGAMDRMAGLGRRAFALAAPILDDLGQGGAVSSGMKAIQGYDQLRDNVMQVDSNVRGHARRIASADLF